MTFVSHHLSSRLSGFYKKPISERVQLIAERADLTSEDLGRLQESLSLLQADKLIENVIGRFALPLGMGTNFLINDRDYLIPMVVEEPSIVAAVSFAAKLVRAGGGFRTGSTDPVMIGQIQLLDVPDPDVAAEQIMANESELLARANTSPSIAKMGGGPRAIQVRQLKDTPSGPMTIVHLLFDCRDAMGANAVNTAVETLAPALERLTGGRCLLRILSNLTDQRRAWAEALIPAASFADDAQDGMEVVQAIADANAFAVADPYRAATHNKGIMNGIDAVALATGNDWRAIEAGAHAYACREGKYRALTNWRVISSGKDLENTMADDPHTNEGMRKWDADSANLHFPSLYGRLELPLAVGTVGGATRSHPTAQVSMKILAVHSAQELSEVMAAVGLAQNLAAIRALATEGIQRGHMSLHARQVAVAAGAEGAIVELISDRMVSEGLVRVERARELLIEFSGGN